MQGQATPRLKIAKIHLMSTLILKKLSKKNFQKKYFLKGVVV